MNIEVTYSLLADIKERQSNIKSLIEVFQELVESLFVNYYHRPIQGLLLDLREKFTEVYRLEIPYPTLKIILARIKNKYGSKFEVYQDYSFKSTESVFIDLTHDIKENEILINELNEIFLYYCKEKNTDNSDNNIFEFIEQSKKELLSYLNNPESFSPDNIEPLIYEFVSLVNKIEKYRKIFEKLILGSIISSYFDIIPDENCLSKTLLLDTNFLISLMDLHTQESFTTCETIVKTANKLNYKLSVLPETINETQNLLRRKAEKIDNITLFSSQRAHTIEGGCQRRKLKKLHLTLYADKIENFLNNKNIKIIDKAYNEKLREEAISSDLFQKLSLRPFNKEGVLHDAISMLYIKKLRISDNCEFKNVNSFFVTDTAGYLDNKISSYTSMPYIIRAEELLNILWLSSPTFDTQLVNSFVTRMLSMHLEKKLPDKDMLARIDEKIDFFAQLGLNEKDCVDLANSISEFDTTELNLLLLEEEHGIFKNKLAEFADIARQHKTNYEKKINDEFSRIINFLESQHMIQKKETIESLQNKMIGLQTTYEDNSKDKDKIYLEELINRDADELKQIEGDISIIKREIDKKFKFISYLVVLVIILSFLYIALTKIVPFWSNVEPFTYIIACTVIIVTSAYIFIHGESFNFVIASKNIKLKLNKGKYLRLNELLSRKELLHKRMEDNTEKINNILL